MQTHLPSNRHAYTCSCGPSVRVFNHVILYSKSLIRKSEDILYSYPIILLLCWLSVNLSIESTVDLSCHVMLMLLEMDARLDRHLGIMKRTVFIQIKILVNPSLGPPLIINATFCNERSVSNYVIHWE